MSSGKKVPDLEANSVWLKKVKVDDVVGIDYNIYKITEVGASTVKGINALTKAESEISAEDLTLAIGTGFAEILYRKGKPFGIKTTKKVKLTIVDHSKEEEPKTEQA
jgi:hypothetical protein